MWTNVTYCQSWRPEADQLIQPCLYRIWGGRALVIHIMLLGERPGYIIAPKSLQMGTCQEDDTWHDDWTWWKQWNVLPIIRVNCLNVTHTRFPLTAPLNSRPLSRLVVSSAVNVTEICPLGGTPDPELLCKTISAVFPLRALSLTYSWRWSQISRDETQPARLNAFLCVCAPPPRWDRPDK